ncbi:PucR family transcriptional regulator ligand-binding domain-containing protein [Clostridium tyrobutyricum]|uniref:PucR family transcriptional regulator n=1 Tax=Clostridium tyrobutyricum TaxID=1519 RepID=UPI001C38874A|nr:PucR family transcriptional regulator [Clostridium tyrobutyricum]MBV4418864.1 PucR family transcriptional regulator ligand-binding domain-containing protein [Clostridium tyrobutyricum]
MQIILNEALKLHPLNKSKIIAGANGLNRPIDQFGVLEAPDSFHFVKSNEFLMTTGYMFKDNPELQYKIVKELYNRDVCALGIKINRYINKIPKKIIDFCNNNDFPLLYIPNEYGWYDFFSPLLYLMHIIQLGTNKDVLNKMASLSDIILNSISFDEIVKHIYKVFNIPCSIYINYNSMSACYPPKSPISEIDITELIDEFENPRNNFIINNIKRIPFENESILFCALKHKMSFYGYIFLYEKKRELKSEDISLFQYVIICVQSYVNRFLGSNRKFSTKQNKFLLNLVKNKNIDKSNLLYKSNELKIDLYKDYIVSISKNLPISEYEDLDKIYTFIENNINIKYKVLSAFEFNKDYIIFNPVDKNISPAGNYKNTTSKIIKIKKELESFFHVNTFSFGIGTYHTSIDGIRTSYDEAVRAFDSYKKFFNNSFIINFKDLGIYSILSNPNINEDIQNFANKYIGPLIAFDKKNNSELIITLKNFFECHRSFRSCAKEMNLHHNTIRYRLKKIEEICCIDTTSENDLLELEISLRLLPFISKSI